MLAEGRSWWRFIGVEGQRGGHVTEPLSPGAVDGLLELAGGDREFVGELIDGYLTESEGLLRGLREANGDELIRAAHTLKSTSASFGASGLAAICSEIERAVGHGPRRDDLVAAAEREYAGVRAALATERLRLP
jgi:HPt (histidine-containing phosphotransfer) domain-containing protein